MRAIRRACTPACMHALRRAARARSGEAARPHEAIRRTEHGGRVCRARVAHVLRSQCILALGRVRARGVSHGVSALVAGCVWRSRARRGTAWCAACVDPAVCGRAVSRRVRPRAGDDARWRPRWAVASALCARKLTPEWSSSRSRLRKRDAVALRVERLSLSSEIGSMHGAQYSWWGVCCSVCSLRALGLACALACGARGFDLRPSCATHVLVLDARA